MLIVLCSQAVAADYLGKVLAVSDGDTFTMESGSGKVRVRICGIDAPERGQPGYGQAAGVLSNMIEGKTLHCLQVGEGTVCDAGRSRPATRRQGCCADLLLSPIARAWITSPPSCSLGGRMSSVKRVRRPGPLAW
jgi:hypothetical protein